MFGSRLLVATHNPGKLREYRAILADLPLQVTYLDAEGIDLEVAETGQTLEENAVLKATTYARLSGLLTWADDSGLEVDALGGQPGVYSARFGAPVTGSDGERTRLLLDRLSAVPDGQRAARFRCVVAIATPTSEVWTTQGSCEGAITFEARGDHGFGYDPIFSVAEFEHRLTMAELAPDIKNRISHRAQAARAGRELLRELLRG